MFVVMALITTVSTTPLTVALYPPWYQRKLESWKRGEIDWDGNPLNDAGSDTTQVGTAEKLQSTQVRRLLVYLRLDSLPSLFTFIALLGGDRLDVVTKVHKSKLSGSEVEDTNAQKRPLEVHGLRMLELTERTSSVMKVSEGDEYSYRDPIVNAFRSFAQINNVAVSGGVSVVPEDSFAETLHNQALDHASDLVLLPWNESTIAEESAHGDFSAHVQDTFIQKALETATTNTAVFINRGFGGPVKHEQATLVRTSSGLSLRNQRETVKAPIADRSHHVYFPFFGGPDDRVALRFVLQLAQNTNITATIVHFIMPIQSPARDTFKSPEITSSARRSSKSSPVDDSQLVISERIDTGMLYSNAAQDTALLHTLRDSLPQALINRVVFVDVATTTPVTENLRYAQQEIAQSPRNAGDLIVVGRAKHNTIAEFDLGGSSEKRKTLGLVAESLLSAGIRGSVLVMQAAGSGLSR